MATVFFSLWRALATIAISTMRAVTATTVQVRSIRVTAASLTTCTSIQAMCTGTATAVTTGTLSALSASSVQRIYLPQNAKKTGITPPRERKLVKVELCFC